MPVVMAKTESAKTAGDGIRTHDFQLGKQEQASSNLLSIKSLIFVIKRLRHCLRTGLQLVSELFSNQNCHKTATKSSVLTTQCLWILS